VIQQLFNTALESDVDLYCFILGHVLRGFSSHRDLVERHVQNIALLNARQRWGRVEYSRSHGVRDKLLETEDAVVVVSGVCRMVRTIAFCSVVQMTTAMSLLDTSREGGAGGEH